MAAISSLQIGGVTYDIYAKSAEQAPVGSHELSSHSHFSTYFNGTSANSALTSKSALSAGSAAKAASATSALTAGSADKVRLISLDNASNYQVILGATGTQNLYYDSDLNIQYNTSSNTFYSPNISATNISGNSISAGKLTGTQFILVSASATEANITAANAAGVNAINNPKIGFWNSAANQKGYIIWTDYNNSNTWVNADSAFYGGAALSDGFVVTSDQLNSILVSKNLSATNFKATKISATNLTATNITGTLEGAARRLAKRSISFSRTVAQGGDGKKWCRIASISRPNFTTASEWGSSEAELNIYTKSYGENNTVDRGKIVLYCRWGHASASSPTYSMKTNGSRGARWLYWKPQQTSTSVSADSSVSAYAPFNGLKNVDIKIVANDTSVEWWLYNDVWDTTLEITESYSNNITLYGKDSAKTLGDFKTYIEDNRSQWDDVQGDGSYINYAISAKAAPVASHTISSHSDSANFFSGNSARSACSATSAKNAGTASYATSAGAAPFINHDHNYKISAGTTAFDVSSNIQLSAGTNIGLVSAGTNVIGITAKDTTPNNKTITITSGASPATGSFTLNQNSDKTITLGTMAFKASGDFALTSHNHNYKLSGAGTALDVSAGINLKPNGNIAISTAANTINISAKDTTYTSLNGVNSTEYNALTGVSGVKSIKNYAAISAASGTTSKGSFAPANSADTFTLIAGNNIDFVSGANSLTISSKSYTIPTVNNKTITITTAASPSTSQTFTLNQSTDKTISFGTMAFKASGDYSTTSHNHYLSALNGTATYFSGTTASPSALSALTSKSALSAGSATKALTATYDSAGNVIDTTYGKKVNDVYYVTAGYNATTYPNYDTTKTYATGAYIVTGSRVYSASAAVTVAGSWASNSSKFTTASTTVVWSGNTTATSEVTALTAGLKISLKVPSNMSGAATTQLNLNSLGAKTIRRNNGNLTTHLPFGTIVYLTYDGTYWVWADYDSNSNNYVGQYSATDSQNYPIILKRTTGGQETQTVKYASAFTYNPSTSSLKASNISSTNITATTFSGNLSGNATSAKNAGTATYATSAGAAPFISHDHGYNLSGNGTAVNVSAGVNFKPSGSNVKFYVSGNDIYISAKNDNSTAYIPSGFQISGINGTTTGVYYLSALKLNAGTNIGFTSASNSQITITAKDTNKIADMSDVGTYFTGTTAKLATSASGAGSATKAVNDNYGNAINASSYLTKSWSGATASLFSGKASSAVSASTAAKATWVAKSDNQEYKMAFSLNSEFNYNTNYTYNPSLQRLTIPSAAKIGGCTLQWNASTSALDFNF